MSDCPGLCFSLACRYTIADAVDNIINKLKRDLVLDRSNVTFLFFLSSYKKGILLLPLTVITCTSFRTVVSNNLRGT